MPGSKRRKSGHSTDVNTNKHATVKRRGLQGRLAGIDDLPLDVLFEIFSKLAPIDLLRISRVSKPFRSLVLSISAKQVWKEARASMPDLPAGLQGMSEPAFLSLLLEKMCSFCSQITSKKVAWALRKRICSNCEIAHVRELSAWEFHGNVYDELEGVLDEDEELNKGLHLADDGTPLCLLVPWSSECSRRDHVKYLVAEMEAVRREYHNLPPNSEARTVFKEEKQAEIALIDEDVAAIQSWMVRQERARETEIDDNRSARYTEIVARLTAAGWAEDLAQIKSPHSLQHLDIVKKPQRITERIWRNIEPALTDFMQSMRQLRLRHETINTRSQLAAQFLRNYRIAHLNRIQYLPGPVDFCNLIDVKDIIERPNDVQVQLSDFEALTPHMKELCTSWIRIAMIRLADIMNPLGQASVSLLKKLRNDVSLAKCVWICKEFDCHAMNHTDTELCVHGEPNYFDDDLTSRMDVKYVCDDDDPIGHHRAPLPLFFPEILSHECLVRERGYKSPSQARADHWKLLDIASNQNCSIHRSSFMPVSECGWQTVRFDQGYSRSVKEIIRAAGLDENKATAKDLDALAAKFACLKCHRECDDGIWSQVWVSGWREMLRHHKARHLMDLEPLVQMVDLDLCRSANVVASKRLDPKEWLCLHCIDTPRERLPMTKSAVKEHLRSDVHSKTSLKQGVDYCLSASSPPVFAMSGSERDKRELMLIRSSLLDVPDIPYPHSEEEIFEYETDEEDYDLEEEDEALFCLIRTTLALRRYIVG